jgi:acyl-CoA synthetase (NDP forming)
MVPHDVSEALAGARADGRDVLLETEARQLVADYGVPVVPAVLCTTPEAAAEYARDQGGFLALKAVSPAAPHKTEAGGVALNVAPEAVSEMSARVRASVSTYTQERGLADDFRGVLVMPMLERPIAEVLVGVRQDPSFGPTLTVGVGGTLTELVEDVALRVPPVIERAPRRSRYSNPLRRRTTSVAEPPTIPANTARSRAHELVGAVVPHAACAAEARGF